MNLIVNAVTKVFDVSVIKRGDLLYAKHKTWQEGKRGFVTAISGAEIIVQYHPGIGNVTNHFFLPADEVVAGEWEVRWSRDLRGIGKYGMEG